MLQKPSGELLNYVPLSAIVGEVTLSGEAFKRQLALGHSAYNLINPELGFIGFVGLHQALPDGVSGQFYWMFMQPDSNIPNPDHWLQRSSQQEKLNHVLQTVAPLAPELREIFELTPVGGIRKDLHVWKDLELDNLPAGRVALLGDAAHTMTPAGGLGAFHAMIDALKLGRTLCGLEIEGNVDDMSEVKKNVGDYHDEMIKRGSAAVRTSRASYKEAEKRALTKEHFTRGLRPLPLVRADEIILQTR